MIWANLIGSLTLGALCAGQEPPPSPPAAKPKVTVGRTVGAEEGPQQKKDGKDQGSPPGSRDAGKETAKVTPPAADASRSNSESLKDLVIPKARPREESTPSYRVSIRLPGGRRFTGVIVRDPAFHKTVFAGQHHKPEAYLSSRSLKLHFVDGLDGEVELRWNQLARVEVRDVVTDTEILAMQRVSELARIERAQQTRAQREREKAAPEGKDSGTGEEETGTPAAEEERADILQRFPPEDGWSAERKRQIEWRRTVVGTFPTEEEQAFLDHFEEWEAEAKAWTAEQVERMEAERKELEKKKQQIDRLEKQVLEDATRRPRPVDQGTGAPPPSRDG